MIIHDDEIEIEIEEAASATSDKNSHQSVFREKMLEHIFVSELLKYAWRNDNFSLEIARAEIDRSGHDLIVEANGIYSPYSTQVQKQAGIRKRI